MALDAALKAWEDAKEKATVGEQSPTHLKIAHFQKCFRRQIVEPRGR